MDSLVHIGQFSHTSGQSESQKNASGPRKLKKTRKPDLGLLTAAPMAPRLFYPPIDYRFNHDTCGPKPSQRMHTASGYSSRNTSVQYPE
jgi:hypothetical protein